MNELWVIYALIFGAAVMGVQAAMLLVKSRKTEKSVNRRLLLTAQGASPTAVLETLRRERGFGDYNNNAFVRYFGDFWTQTGLRFDRNAIFLWCFGVGAAFFLVLSAMVGFGFGSFFLSILFTCAGLYLFLAMVRKRRIARFSEQLPEAIEVIVRGVKVGYPFSTAMSLVAREMPDPIGTEFGMTADETTFGLDISVALENLYRRVGQQDLLFLIIAISIQSQTGGKLADILGRLARLIRQRATLRLKVRALSAEGRLSAIFLSLMPFILVGVISLLSPSYFGSVLGNPILYPAAVVGLTLLSIGNVIMYRMVNFKF